MKNTSKVARPRTRDQLEEIAWRARGDLGLRPFERVPVLPLIEWVLPKLIDGFDYEVVENSKLGKAEATTSADRPLIRLSESTYSALERDNPRARMTAIHEIGHLLLHTNQTAYAFQRKYHKHSDPEWQADVFAGAFLMPECAFREMESINTARKAFGVSKDAAWFRARQLKMWDLVNGLRRPTKTKKGYDKRRTP